MGHICVVVLLLHVIKYVPLSGKAKVYEGAAECLAVGIEPILYRCHDKLVEIVRPIILRDICVLKHPNSMSRAFYLVHDSG